MCYRPIAELVALVLYNKVNEEGVELVYAAALFHPSLLRKRRE